MIEELFEGFVCNPEIDGEEEINSDDDDDLRTTNTLQYTTTFKMPALN